MRPSESQVRSAITPWRVGRSPRRSIGTIGNTWSIAQMSGIDWNTEKFTKYLSTSFSFNSSSVSRCERSSGFSRPRTRCAMA